MLSGHGKCDICGHEFDDLQRLHDHRNVDRRCGKKKHFSSVERYHVYRHDQQVGPSSTTPVSTCLQGPLEFYFANWCAHRGVAWSRPDPLSYEVEGKARKYYPDFYLPEHDVYIETKGKYLDKDVIKMRSVLQRHPGLRICLIRETDMRPLFELFSCGSMLFDAFGMDENTGQRRR